MVGRQSSVSLILVELATPFYLSTSARRSSYAISNPGEGEKCVDSSLFRGKLVELPKTLEISCLIASSVVLTVVSGILFARFPTVQCISKGCSFLL